MFHRSSLGILNSGRTVHRVPCVTPEATISQPDCGAALAKRIRVLVIDDNRLVREGLAALLDAQPDLKVVAAGEDTPTGVNRLLELKPHVVLMDAGLENGDTYRGVETLRRTAP